jgi:hypothetical protein
MKTVKNTEPTRNSFPLDGAPYGSGLRGGRLTTPEDCLDGVDQVVAPNGCRIVIIVVYRAVIAQSAAPLEEEDLGSTLGSVGPGDLLGFIVQVREIEPFFLGALFHLGEAIIGILICVVGADGDELDATAGVVGLYVDQAVFPGSGVGTMVTGEDHRDGFFVRVVCQGVALIVHSRQVERYCLIARA